MSEANAVSNNNGNTSSTVPVQQRQVQFLTPRKHNRHQNCAYKEIVKSYKDGTPEKFCRHQQEHFSSFDSDRVVLLPEPKDR